MRKKIRENNSLKQKDAPEFTDQEICDIFLYYFINKHHIDLRAINKEVEESLFRRIEEGDPVALREITRAYSWLAKESATLYYKFRKDTPLRKLKILASLSIKEAAKHYKTTRGYRFATYAMWWILTAFGVEINKIIIPQE